MTVNEMIKELQYVENKDLQMMVYDVDSGNLYDVVNVDPTSDRIDLNINLKEN